MAGKRYYIFIILMLALLSLPMVVTADETDYDARFENWTEEQYRSYEDSILDILYPSCTIQQIADTVADTQTPSVGNISQITSYSTVPQNVSPDTSKEVGEIPVSTGVNKTGAKTYEIPLEIVSGMNGMQPKLSLSYNSQQGNSAVGYGWNISGIPMISRVGRSMYYDGSPRGVMMDDDDSFSLDGVRLIKIESDDKYTLYESVYGNIKVKGYLSNGNIQYFIVYYPDGNQGHFGRALSGNYLYYPIVSLQDMFGNIISYQYVETDNHYKISQISYNGKSIEFKYDYRSDPLLWYSSGKKVYEDKILQSITHKSGTNEIWTYNLNHTVCNNVSLLTQIEYASGGKSYNPLIFYYGANQSSSAYNISTTQLFEWYAYEKPEAIIVSKGKFDYGSGADGLIVYPNKNPYWKHFRNKGTFNHSENRFDNLYSGEEKIFLYAGVTDDVARTMPELLTEKGFVDILCVDLEGRQEEYVVKINNLVESGRDVVKFNIYRAGSPGFMPKIHSRSYSFNTVYTDKSGGKSIQPKYYYPGDFDGDGKMEILAVSVHEPFGDTSKPSMCYVFDPLNDKILYNRHVLDFNMEFLGVQQTDSKYISNHSDKLFVMDCDGDGKSDICHIHGKGTDVYTFDVVDGGMEVRKLATSSEPSIYDLFYKDVLPGEYNGDGMTDILVSKSSSPGTDVEWTMYNSTGNGCFDKSKFDGPARTTLDYYGFFVQDVNGDGKTDLIAYQPKGFDTYITDRNRVPVSHFYTEFDDKSILIPSDLNSRNSFTQLIGLNGGIVTKFSFGRNDSMDMLSTGMTNSLGVTEKTSYRLLTDPNDPDDFYLRGFDAVYPFINISEPLPVVEKSEKYLNGDLTDRQAFSYSNAVLHRQGLGFCGFQKIKTTDRWEESVVRTYDPYKYGSLVRETSTTYDNTYSYTADVASNKITKLLLKNKQESDLLKGISVTTTFTYDTYGYPTKEDVSYSDGISFSTTMSYSSVPTVENGYYLGLLREKVTVASNDNDSFTERMVIPSVVNRQPGMICRYRDDNQVEMVINAYDSHGNLTSETIKPYKSSNSQLTTYTYNADGLIEKMIDPLGLPTTYTYDLHGNPAIVRECRGGMTVYTYDEFGREISVRYPDNTKKTTSYSWTSDTGGGLYSITTTDRDSSICVTAYDAMGRKVRVSDIRFDGTRRNTDMTYDARGNLQKESLPYFGDAPSYWNTYAYDQYDRLVRYSEASGSVKTYTYIGTEVTTVSDGVTVARDYDSQGNLISVEDPTGVISYDLRSDGQPKRMISPDHIVTSFTYDVYGRRIMVDDPSQGRTLYTYDSSGNLDSERDANGKLKAYVYDIFNRLVKTYTPEFTTNYTYDNFGNLVNVTSDNGTSKTYTYDGLSRLICEEEKATEGVWLRKEFEYSGSNVSSIKYTSAYGSLVKESYRYANGQLTEVNDGDGKVIYKLLKENSLGQPTEIQTGDITRRYGFTPFGRPAWRNATSGSVEIQNVSYTFDNQAPNLLYRSDNMRRKGEEFGYDELNRLVRHGNESTNYHRNGNIGRRSDVGTFGYNHPTKPYAITGMVLYDDAVPLSGQHVIYSSFSRPLSIEEGNAAVRFTYNGDFDRVKMESFVDGKSTMSKYYLGGCYELEDKGFSIRELLYLNGDYYDSPAVFIRNKYNLQSYDTIVGHPIVVNDVSSAQGVSNIGIVANLPATYYILRDYLGSITHIVRSGGNLVAEYSYDAWGRLRNPETFVPYPPGSEPALFLGRGYTGHEHLATFGLINMNARLYDPALGRFLSPDPWIQLPDMSQNLNRYTYAMNNPLCYVDENGEFFWFAIGAAALIGAVTNVAVHWKQIQAAGGGWKGFWRGTAYALAGAAAGAAGTAATIGVGSLLGVYGISASLSSTGIMAGGITGATDGLVSGFMLGTSNSLLEGYSFKESLKIGVGEGLSSSISGAISGGVLGGSQAYREGSNMWNGIKPNSTRGSPNERIYSIYEGFDPDTGVVHYVGRTGRDPEIRFTEHRRSKTEKATLRYRVVDQIIGLFKSKILEQRNINKYKMTKDGGSLYNKRNEIHPELWELYDIKK